MAETTTTAAPTTASPDVKVTLHWLDRSRSQRIVWLLEECNGLSYDIKLYKRGADMLAPPSLKEIHSLGKSPVIDIEAPALSKPLVIAESALISEYLTDYFAPHLVPKRYQEGKDGKVGGESEQWLRYRFFMHYAEGSLMPLLVFSLILDQLKNGPQVPMLAKPITRIIAGRIESAFINQSLKTNFAFLESQLETSPDDGKYLTGKDLTAADILMSFPLISGQSRVDKVANPKLAAYIKTLETNEVYLRSIKKIEEASGEKFVAAFDR